MFDAWLLCGVICCILLMLKWIAELVAEFKKEPFSASGLFKLLAVIFIGLTLFPAIVVYELSCIMVDALPGTN